MLILLCVFLLGGCASTGSDYNQALQPYVGVSEESLIDAFGPPNYVQQIVPNEKLLTYNSNFSGPQYGNDDPYGSTEVYYPAVQNPSYNNLSNAENNTYFCSTTWTIRDNQVTNFSFVGDDCLGAN